MGISENHEYPKNVNSRKSCLLFNIIKAPYEKGPRNPFLEEAQFWKRKIKGGLTFRDI